MALPKVEGLITIPTGGYTLTVTEVPAATTTVTIPAGDYYWNSSTNFCSAIADALTNNATLAGTYTVSIADGTDTSTGYCTISSSGITSFAITWVSTTLRDYLGFAGNTSAGTTATSTRQARYLWLPNTGRTRPMAPDPTAVSQHMGQEVTDFAFTQAASGVATGTYFNTRYRDSFAFDLLKGNKTWIVNESIVNESLQKFYDDVVKRGTRFRYYPDRSDDAVYFTMMIGNAGQFAPDAVVENWTGANSLWNVNYEMWEYVAP